MSLLLLDLGNTRLKWGVHAQDGLHFGDALLWRAGDSDAELATAWRDLPRPDRVLAASVAGAERNARIEAWCRRIWGREVEYLVPRAEACGVRSGYREPQRLGVDRWAALLGAHRRYPGRACAVIDCGTAITCDALDAEGRHLGGAILPGLTLMRQSLTTTAGIDLRPGVGAPEPFANRTTDAVAGGTWLAAVAAIDRFLALLDKRLDRPAQCLVTGGDAPLLAPHLRHAPEVQPYLVLQGLAAAADEPGHFHTAPCSR